MNLGTIRRFQRRLDREFGGLLDWGAFSLDAVRAAVSARVGGEIALAPSHWEASAYFGLAVGYRSASGPRWLVIYEQEAVAEHHMMIVLHELMHIALGHCGARLTADELRQELTRLGLITPPTEAIICARACMAPGDQEAGSEEGAEAEAELAAAWMVAQARRAGGLPPSGQAFSPEQIALDRVLGGPDGRS